jgi:hypothetical protein
MMRMDQYKLYLDDFQGVVSNQMIGHCCTINLQYRGPQMKGWKQVRTRDQIHQSPGTNKPIENQNRLKNDFILRICRPAHL